MANKKKQKNKKQKESNNMEVTLLKSAKLEGVEDTEIIDESFIDTPQNKEQHDIESALELLSNDKEIIIDRDKEDNDVTEFQKTGNLDILERVYKNRIPTLKSWANKNYYPGLTSSVEDLFEDLSVVFVNAAQKYNKKKGAFNSWLFTLLVNRLKNLHSSKYAKKRISEEYDGPLNGMVLSLDFSYNDSDGSDLTLKDIIPGKTDTEDSLDFRDSISFLSRNEPLIKEFFKKICDGNSLASLLKEYKIRNGSIDLSKNKSDFKKLSLRKNKKLATEIIKSHNIGGDFKLLEYELSDDGSNNLKYKIEMRKTKETDYIVKFIRDLKKHKQYYMSKINGD